MEKALYIGVRSRTIRAAISALLLSLSLTLVVGPILARDSEVRLRTRLSGAAIAGKVPEGNADFRQDTSCNRTRIQVEVEEVNLPAGTVLTVMLNNATKLGTLTLGPLGFGELELNSQDGDVVPAVTAGNTITVLNGQNAILAGVF
jgi:hypothetical protein